MINGLVSDKKSKCSEGAFDTWESDTHVLITFSKLGGANKSFVNTL